MATRKFRILYRNQGKLLTFENRTHETGVEPSEDMIRNCMHTLSLNHKVDFLKTQALVYETTTGEDKLIATYLTLSKKNLYK